MDYKILIDEERAKLDVMRAQHALLSNKIAASENFVSALEKRLADEADALDIFLTQQVAANAAPKPSQLPNNLQPLAANGQDAVAYVFPKIRSDSNWPYILRFMSSKHTWRLEELVTFAIAAHLAKTDSAVRSMMSSLKYWGMVNNDRAGVFSLTPKGVAFVGTLKDNEFVIGGTAGTTQSKNDA